MKKFSSETIQKILVPIDGSNHSIRATEYAINIAKVHEAQIIVAYVVDENVIDKFSKSLERKVIGLELKNDGKNFIKYSAGLAEKEGIEVTSMLVKGRPFEQIVNIAKGMNVDLIVMGTYGSRSAEKLLIGSVAERVIEYSPCPVLVVK